MRINTDEIASVIEKQIKSYEEKLDIAEVGEVIQVGDGIARIYGLEKVMYGELIELPNDVFGMALNLEEDNVGVVLFGLDELINEGDECKRTGRIAQVPVGKEMLGRVVDSLGRPLDGKGPINTEEFNYVERKAPGIVVREPVKEPLAWRF